jgi:hypothetical protein
MLRFCGQGKNVTKGKIAELTQKSEPNIHSTIRQSERSAYSQVLLVQVL